jgi:hypothetical protein
MATSRATLSLTARPIGIATWIERADAAEHAWARQGKLYSQRWVV